MTEWAADEIQKLFEEILQEKLDERQLSMDEVEDYLTEETPRLVRELADVILPTLKQQAPTALRENREMEAGFRQRNFERWAKGFDLLELLVGVAHEVGDAISRAE